MSFNRKVLKDFGGQRWSKAGQGDPQGDLSAILIIHQCFLQWLCLFPPSSSFSYQNFIIHTLVFISCLVDKQVSRLVHRQRNMWSVEQTLSWRFQAPQFTRQILKLYTGLHIWINTEHEAWLWSSTVPSVTRPSVQSIATVEMNDWLGLKSPHETWRAAWISGSGPASLQGTNEGWWAVCDNCTF